MRNLVTDSSVMRAVDVDHVVGRTILETFPDSWINLFPVWGAANQGFGHIEKSLPKAVAGFGVILLTPLTAFKLLRSDKRIKTADDLDGEISVAVERLIATGKTAARMRSEIEPVVRNAYRHWLVRLGRKRVRGA